jgi:hypothetical protein
MPTPERFSYNLFISCTAVDFEWVQSFLLPSLGLSPERVICNQFIKGAASFQPDAPIAEEFQRAVKDSRFTLLILSPAYMADVWGVFSKQLVSYVSVAEQCYRLIPVVREQCELPLKGRGRI